ncbi:hypothetical protein EDB83DRAFT_249469 [Lactarius deliciosus]|nr:hypothetical protein EDB83DRAFT_249469 [Lactarius deliciosus]
MLLEALILCKSLGALGSPISLGAGGVHNAELACISAILGRGTEHHEGLLLPHQLRVINFQNVVSWRDRHLVRCGGSASGRVEHSSSHVLRPRAVTRKGRPMVFVIVCPYPTSCLGTSNDSCRKCIRVS